MVDMDLAMGLCRNVSKPNKQQKFNLRRAGWAARLVFKNNPPKIGCAPAHISTMQHCVQPCAAKIP